MSVSSLEGSPVPVDLPTKYQKLATEYAKIRAQLGVLKKAVVEEQSHSSELKETLRIKDQNLRKSEQELESLNFRNQQLTKRITVLQNELDMIQNSSKKEKGKHTSNEGSGSVVMEELQKKISENAHLASMLEEQTEKYENEKFKFIQERESLEHKLAECKKALTCIEGTKLVKAENEIKMLVSKLNAKESELQKLYNEYKTLKIGRAVVNSSLLDVSELKEKYLKFLENLPAKEMLTSFVNFFIYLDHLCKDKGTSELCKKLEYDLNSLKSGYFSDLENSSFAVEFFSGKESLLTGLDDIIDNLEKLNQVVGCSNEEVTKVLKSMVSSFHKHVVQFRSAVKIVTSSHLENQDCVDDLADSFRSLKSTCDYFSSALNDKTKVCRTDEIAEKEILLSLSKLSVQSGAIFRKMSENSETLNQVFKYRLCKEEKTELSENQSEHCCHHEKQEHELMKMRSRVKDLEEQISCLSGAATPRSNNSVQSPVEKKGEGTEITNMFGSLIGPEPVAFEGGQHESCKKYFNNRANVLVADRQLAESKSTALRDELQVLQKRLEHGLECRLVLEASVKQAQDTVNRLQEELTTTTSNYETQLSSMSEHMANMNDKLAAQQEEIEQLNYELTAKGSKKGRSK